MYGLYLKNPTLGPVAGVAISGSMWLLESILVWLFTRSHEPYRKSLWRQKLDAIREAWEMKQIQRIEWIKYDAGRPDLTLVKKVRKIERKREKIIGNDLPAFFLEFQKQDPIKEITAELHRTEPRTINVEHTAVVPIKRPIGFHAEDERRGVQSNVQGVQSSVQAKNKSELAYEYARHLYHKHNELPSCRRIVQYSEQVAERRQKKDLKVSIGTAKTGRDRLIEELNQ